MNSSSGDAKKTVGQKDPRRGRLLKMPDRTRLLEALIACTYEMLASADKADVSEYVRLQMNLRSFSEEYKILTGREYQVGG